MPQNIFRTFFLHVVFILIVGSLTVIAQDDYPSLRDLADLNNLDIGAAVHSYQLDIADHAATLGSQFNFLTHEHEAKPCALQSQQGVFDFRAMDEITNFAEANNMGIHGHTLVWHQCTQDWVIQGDFPREEAIQYLRDYIMTVVGRYQGRINIWDVVNEYIQDDDATIRETPWQRLIGDDYIDLAFQFAHEADPNAKLFYNDYGIEGMGGKANVAYEMVSGMLDRGIPIHGIGLQGHFTVGAINEQSIRDNVERFGELGLEVHFTELDVRFQGEPTVATMQQLARDYHTLMRICLDSDACTTYIVWGVTDQFTWLRNENLGFFNNPEVAPLLFDDQYQPKLAYFALLDLLAERAGEDPILTDQQRIALFGSDENELEIPDPTYSDPDQLPPDSIAGRIYYAPYPVTISLDGNVDDWTNIPQVTLEDGSLIPDDNDTSMSFAVAADDTHLYFLADVMDSTVVYGNYGTDEWYREDSIEFYLNTTGDLEASTYANGIVQMGFMAANIAEDDQSLLGGINSGDAEVSFVVIKTDDGYRVEAAVPLVNDVWNIEPSHESVLGFQAHLNGSSADDRDTKLIWSVFDTQDQSWQNPSLFGQLIFWDIDQ